MKKSVEMEFSETKPMGNNADVKNLIMTKMEKTKKNRLPNFCELKEDGRVKVNHTLLYRFLEFCGYATISNNDELTIVHIQGKIVEKVTLVSVKRQVIKYLEKFDNPRLTSYFSKNREIFTKKSLVNLKQKKPSFIHDTKYTVNLKYRNGIVRGTYNGEVKLIPYEQSEKMVWKHQIIDRDFFMDDFSKDNSEFSTFLARLADGDTMRYQYLCSLIGYALHNYRTADNNKVIIFNDKYIAGGREGSSGKRLLSQFLGKIRSIQEKNGQTSNYDNKYYWSDVDKNAEVVFIDNIKEDFPIQEFALRVTKNHSVYNSPQFIISSREPIKRNNTSLNQKLYFFEFNNYFNRDYTPLHEFGHFLFYEWDENEWANFDRFILKCVMFYLRKGVLLNPDEIEEKKITELKTTNELFSGLRSEIKKELKEIYMEILSMKKLVLQ